MASPGLEHRSPFGNILGNLPQGHDKALKQAFYNTAATLFAVIVCIAGIAVYHILEVFLRPLLWAVLCGTFLHPFKSTLTVILKSWLHGLSTRGTPLVLGIPLIPIKILDTTSESVGSFLQNNLKPIIGALVAIPAVYLLYYFELFQIIFAVLVGLFNFTYTALGYVSSIWIWTLILAYVILVAIYWTPTSSSFLIPLSIPVWLAIVFNVANFSGYFKVPLAIFVVVLMIVGFMSEVSDARRKQSTGELQSPASPTAIAVWNIWSSSNIAQCESPRPPPAERGADEVEDVSASETEEKPQPETPKTSSEDAGSGASKAEDRPQQLDVKSSTEDPSPKTGAAKKKERTLSDKCFIALIWSLIVVRLWKSMWIFQLLPILFGCLVLKKLGVQVGSWQFLRDKVQNAVKPFKDRFLNDERCDLLAPKPIRGLGKLILRGDRKIVASLEKSMDKYMSILIILLLLFGTVFFAFFAVIQVQRESMHLVSVTSNVLNNSLHPELSQWLPAPDAMQETLDSMVGDAYIYGREWIGSKIHSLVDGDEAAKAKMEKQVLDLWDRMYESFFAKNTTTPVLARQDSFVGIDLNNMSNVWDLVKETKEMNFDIVSFLKENIGIFMSVMESVWSVLKGNVSLAINVLTAVLSVVFGGGTAVLNFIIAFVIFITTLFYLLSSSGEQYKPVEWFSKISAPTQTGTSGNTFGKAVEEAIASVFLASLKMAAFYGLYTWLTHSLFGIQIVFIPSALAALFAAIPFLGTYWAALPAVIELWLVNGLKVEAILLFLCHMIPTYVVDTAIYSEIKGGHPYFTALSIAGGIYWMGLEGAIIGPILLCCLQVAMNVYVTMFKPEEETTVQHPRVKALIGKKLSLNLKRAFSQADASTQ